MVCHLYYMSIYTIELSIKIMFRVLFGVVVGIYAEQNYQMPDIKKSIVRAWKELQKLEKQQS